MLRALRTISCLLLLSVCVGAAGDPEIPPDRNRIVRPAGKPLVMAYLREPSLTVVGADSPAFALYDDGTVIFRSIRGEEKQEAGPSRSGFRAVKLAAGELESLKRTLALDEIERPSPDRADPADRPDESSIPVELVLSDEKGFYLVRVSQIRSRRAVAGASTMLSFDHADAVAWMPDQVQVLLWPADPNDAQAIPWPDDWPRMDRAVTWTLPVHADHEAPPKATTGYALRLDMSQVARLRAILRKSAHERPVQIDDKRFLLTYRLPFPGERELGAVE